MMQSYSVTFTSTETLFDEEKQRKQNSISIKAKTDEEARLKVMKQLTESGRHNQIIIHTVQLDKRQPRNKSAVVIVIGAVLFIFLILQVLFK